MMGQIQRCLAFVIEGLTEEMRKSIDDKFTTNMDWNSMVKSKVIDELIDKKWVSYKGKKNKLNLTLKVTFTETCGDRKLWYSIKGGLTTHLNSAGFRDYSIEKSFINNNRI